MSKRIKKETRVSAWLGLSTKLQESVPHLAAWYGDVEAFSELRIKARADGTLLAIAKGYGSDGGPVVCFGSGYDVAACLLAVDASINGGNWRFDKPWDNNEK